MEGTKGTKQLRQIRLNIPNGLPSNIREAALTHQRNDTAALLAAELRQGWQPSHDSLE